jgi:hypothetical protein
MRVVRWSVGFTLLFMCCASSASAQGWGREFMEKLSGPGPFEGIGLQFPVGCQWITSDPQKFYWVFQTPIAQTPGKNDLERLQGRLDEKASRFLCIDFQYTSMSNKDRENGNIGLIAVRSLEGRVGFPLERWRDMPWLAAFEPSVAAGAIRFLGNSFGEWRMTLSPEIVVKPLKFIPANHVKLAARRVNRRGDWRSLIEFAYGAILITPKITNEDLHVVNQEEFEHGWLQRAVWIRVNASELFGLR